jgi:Arc/MetJ-type ribon-helix-helix transcriptional regulator
VWFKSLSTAMNAKRTHVVLSDQLVKEIDTLVGARQRSSFISEATERELMRRRQIEALKAAAGAWKDEDHPELKQGSGKWVRKLRQDSEKRFQKGTSR